MYKAIYRGYNSIYNYIVGAHVVQLTGNSLKNQAGKKYTAKMNMKQKKNHPLEKECLKKLPYLRSIFVFAGCCFLQLVGGYMSSHAATEKKCHCPNPLKRISQATMELEKKSSKNKTWVTNGC